MVMSVHRRATTIRNVFAVVIVAGLATFLALKATQTTGMHGASQSSPETELDRAYGRLEDGDAIAMP
jgi:hypothetical protein